VSAESDKLADQIAAMEERAQAFDESSSPLSILLEAANAHNSILFELDNWLTCQNISAALAVADRMSKELWEEIEGLERRYEALVEEDDD